MIDPHVEQVMSLTAAAKTLPSIRNGKRPHMCSIYWWSMKGLKGIVLETILISGTRCTSREALLRFFERLTVAANTPKNSVFWDNYL